LKVEENVRKWIIQTMNDPIVKILLKNSNLTKTQLETLLIDVLAENFSGKPLSFDDKARLRLLRGGVSRGAFNRTLRQAKKNIIRALYTIFLLGYLGVFEEIQLDPYIEVSNRIRMYVDACRKRRGGADAEEELRLMRILHEELRNLLEHLSEPRSLKRR